MLGRPGEATSSPLGAVTRAFAVRQRSPSHTNVGAEVVAGDRQGGREGFEPVGARAVSSRRSSREARSSSRAMACGSPAISPLSSWRRPLEAVQACSPATWASSVSVLFVAAHARGRSSQH